MTLNRTLFVRRSCMPASRKSLGYRNGVKYGFALGEDQIDFLEMPAVGLGK